jgi:DNA-binding MarR family transcriptional regulator
VAESARAGLRELDRLEAAAGKGAVLTADLDVRSRLPDALEAALRIPALTPRMLAQRLRITPQAATRLLATLTDAGIVAEITGRKSFRAFAV